jgi:hypothetical protein
MNQKISQRSLILVLLLTLCLGLGWMGCTSTLKRGNEDPSKVQDMGVKYYF